VIALRLAVSRNGGSRFELDVAAGAVVGSGAAADVRLPDDSVAADHARFEHDGGWWLVIRAGAVRVDGAVQRAGARIQVQPGTELQVGPYRLVIAEVRTDGMPSIDRTASLARELVRELLTGPAGAAPELVCEAGPSSGDRRRLPAPEARVVVGRGDGVSWVILDPNLSRAHAAIDRGWDGTRVIDLGSKNGTRVAGVMAPTETPGRTLADGDVIELGETRLRYIDPAEQYLRDLDARLATMAPSAPPPSVPTLPAVTELPVMTSEPAVTLEMKAPRRRAALPLLVAVVIVLIAVVLLVLLLS
jgi:predicted component of type VI protein secretion system